MVVERPYEDQPVYILANSRGERKVLHRSELKHCPWDVCPVEEDTTTDEMSPVSETTEEDTSTSDDSTDWGKLLTFVPVPLPNLTPAQDEGVATQLEDQKQSLLINIGSESQVQAPNTDSCDTKGPCDTSSASTPQMTTDHQETLNTDHSDATDVCLIPDVGNVNPPSTDDPPPTVGPTCDDQSESLEPSSANADSLDTTEAPDPDVVGPIYPQAGARRSKRTTKGQPPSRYKFSNVVRLLNRVKQMIAPETESDVSSE